MNFIVFLNIKLPFNGIYAPSWLLIGIVSSLLSVIKITFLFKLRFILTPTISYPNHTIHYLNSCCFILFKIFWAIHVFYKNNIHDLTSFIRKNTVTHLKLFHK